MAYTPLTWVDGTTSANAANLNHIENGVAANDAALAAQASRTPARFLAKAQAGLPVKVTVLGDSVYQGSTASVPGTNDAISLFCSAIGTRYGVTVTKSNQAQGGRTAWWEKLEKWPTALADSADLYVIAMTGKNDGAWDTGSLKQGGYERGASLAMVESMIRELQSSRPTADIMVASGNPYGTASTSANTQQKAYSAGLATLAAAYGLPYADGWNLTPRQSGYADAAADSYLYETAPNGVHPNDAGHTVLSNAMLGCCPANFNVVTTQAPLAPARPPGVAFYPLRQSAAGIKTTTTASTTAGTDRLIPPSFTAAGWTAGTVGPWTSSTVGNAAWFLAKATDIFAMFTYGAGQGTIDIHVDGLLVAAAVDLSAYTTGKWLAIASGLPAGVHNVRIVVASGTVTLQQVGWTTALCEFVPITAARIVSTNLGVADNTNEWYGMVSANSTATTTVSLDFVGTGVLLHGRSATGGNGGFYFASVKIDGVAVAGPIWPANMLSEVANVALPGCTGLPYGKHTILLTLQAAGLYLGGFSVIDESSTARPTTCQGIAKVGETVTFPYPWTDTPAVTVTALTANAAGAASVTPAGFVVTGTAGDLVRWQATSAQRGVY